jgi:hypothetical protein
MINTQMIEHCIRLAIYSTAIKNETPVSIILLAPPEHGKSEVLKKFAFIKTIKLMTNFDTPCFIEFANEYALGNKRTLIIPDFLRVTKRKQSTQGNSLTILNSMTEEGWIGTLPLGQKIEKPIIANLITAITKEEITDKRHKWAQIGFISRLIPLSFSYNNDTKTMIKNYIMDRVYHTDKAFDFELPKEKIDVILPKELAKEIDKISVEILVNLKEQTLTGFRLLRQLQVLAMSNALSSGRNVVTENDVEMIKQITKFINFNFEEV